MTVEPFRNARRHQGVQMGLPVGGLEHAPAPRPSRSGEQPSRKIPASVNLWGCPSRKFRPRLLCLAIGSAPGILPTSPHVVASLCPGRHPFPCSALSRFPRSTTSTLVGSLSSPHETRRPWALHWVTSILNASDFQALRTSSTTQSWGASGMPGTIQTQNISSLLRVFSATSGSFPTS